LSHKRIMVVSVRQSNGISHHHHRQRRDGNDNILLRLFRLIASEPILLILLCLWNVIAIFGVVVLSQRLDHIALPSLITVPDLRLMGYTSIQIYDDFYHVIGKDGCVIYSTLALWDIFILIPAYTLVLGTLYVHVTRSTYDKVYQERRGYWNADQRAYLVVPIAISDLIETYIQRRGCTLMVQPQLESHITIQQLSNIQIRIASMAVSMKWSLLGLFFISVVERLYRGYFVTGSKPTVGLEHRPLPLWM
jgi:hypothetical protein